MNVMATTSSTHCERGVPVAHDTDTSVTDTTSGSADLNDASNTLTEIPGTDTLEEVQDPRSGHPDRLYWAS